MTANATPDPERLERILGTPHLAWLVERVRMRASEGRELTGPVTLAAASPEQRRAVDGLLGRAPTRAKSLSVRLEDLDAVLRSAGLHPGGLRAAVEQLTGPIPDKRAIEHAREQAWRAACEPLDTAVAGHPHLAPWWSRPQTRATFKRLAGGDPVAAAVLADQASAVLAALPADGVSLPVLAARTAGDAHALDADRPLGRLLSSATERWAAALAADPDALLALPGAELRRAEWAELGVSLDELSSRVLALGLPGDPIADGGLGRLLAVGREAGEPLALTLRQINRAARSGQDPFGVGEATVSVCENPAVLEAAAQQLGPACPPMICVEGHLSVAARALLRTLSAHGARIRYHGDFDWGGLRIANSVHALVDATPWRYGLHDYLAAVDQGHGSPLNTGKPCDAVWDPQLQTAITTHAVRIEEESLLTDLLHDLTLQT